MTTKLLVKIVGITMLCVSIGLQLFVLLFTLYDLATTGRVNFPSVFGYGASQPFAIPAFLIGLALTYKARRERSIKWAYGIFFGSHVVILACTFLFTGRFSP